MSIEIILIAGEASGDLLGAKLIRALKRKNPNIKFSGVGGNCMIKEGFESIFDMKDLSIMGFAEIIPHIPKILMRISQTARYVNRSNAKIVITIDSPSFSFRVMKKVTKDIFKMHYVAPTVWAYNENRAKKISKIYDFLAVLLPFEPPYFEKYGLKTKYVGHPVVEEFQDCSFEEEIKKFKDKFEIIGDLITIMPGSRENEVRKLLPIFIEAVNRVALSRNITIVIPTLPNICNIVDEYLEMFKCNVMICDSEERIAAFKLSKIGLIKSGTGAVEVALSGLPHLIAYKINFISAAIIKHKIKIKFVNLVNIIAGKEIVTEMLQEKCNVDDLYAEMSRLLNVKKDRDRQISEMIHVVDQLGLSKDVKPSDVLADEIVDLI